MDLFDHADLSQQQQLKPLAERLRPQKLSDLVGQKNLFGQQSVLKSLIAHGQLPNLILWGPPGTGKTSFALALSKEIEAEFIAINAIESGAKELRQIGEDGRNRRRLYQRKTVLFVDEIHRFNKGQQDVLLPFIEHGDLILVGATTENPSYELNKALLSRCRVLVFNRLSLEDLENLLHKAGDSLGVKVENVLTPEFKNVLLENSDGDARRLLNTFEILANYHKNIGRPLNEEEFQQALSLALPYDKNSEFHYDLISAFIKSVRGSDPDAAVYYMARMLEGGEDPVFIARRLIILASEDIGNADPRALTVAVSGLQAVEAIGLPEGAITLAQVTTYLASCPKSNRSYMSLNKAREEIEKSRSLPVPLHLRSSKTKLSKDLGYGQGYLYPHDHPKAWVPQSYLPKEIAGATFYEPSQRGFEKNITEYMEWLKSQKKPENPG
jgi:putative ATPase